MSESTHVSVLHKEAIDALRIKTDGRYVDATYGRGGHSKTILERLGEHGELMAIDRDPEAQADADRRLGEDTRFIFMRGNFAEIDTLLDSNGWLGSVDGLLLDLGVSSPQLDIADRGFGFSRDGALDMRMDPLNGVSAADWLATVKESDLVHVLKTYGEERYARRIASAIVEARDAAPIKRTSELAEIVKRAHPRWERHHHPATRSFQAIRIAVNGELDAIAKLLQKAQAVLNQGGRLVVISFHSLEDRMVKRALRKPLPPADLPRHLPLPDGPAHPWSLVGKAVKASAEELALNPRARSAVMRVAERVL